MELDMEQVSVPGKKREKIEAQLHRLDSNCQSTPSHGITFGVLNYQ